MHATPMFMNAPSWFLDVVQLAVAAGLIFLSAEVFVNGVEHLGRKLSFGATATGTILAAFGTALPESVVTLVAAVFAKSDAERELAVGAAVGGPLALATIAYATVGVTLLVAGRALAAGPSATWRRLSVDQAWFLGLFAAKIGLGLVVFSGKPWCGIVFLLAYAVYVRREMTQADDLEALEPAPLFLAPRRGLDPSTAAVVLQTALAVGVIFFASRLFVGRLETLSPALGLSPQLTALLLSPIATELPETMNAIIWARQGKARLALANISGAMMIQASVPTAIGLFFTPWRLAPESLLAAGATAASILVLFFAFRSGRVTRARLAGVGLLYVAFVAALFVMERMVG
ncbi:MAG: hypothetical protein K2Q06_00130 [Parvularculaceae bacterium]|nr:hypothetical protein [Parvularculaceae bacterium]